MDDVIKIYKERLLSINDATYKDKTMLALFQEIGINPSDDILTITNNQFIIIDPIYLCDLYNEDGIKERYLKENGVLMTDFGGDISGQIFRTHCKGIKILLVFDRVDEDGNPIFSKEIVNNLNDYEVNSENLGCDSGSYIFLDYNEELKNLFSEELEENINNFVVVNKKNGSYKVSYEQWDTNEQNPYESWRRNIVIFPLK